MKFETKVKKTALAAALTAAIGMSAIPGTASADVVTFNWNGLFTMLTPLGAVMNNPNFYTNSYAGDRSEITGTMTFDTATGAGSGTLNDFSFFDSVAQAYGINMQAIGDGAGNPGSLVLVNMSFNWSTNTGIPVSLVLDAAGMFGTMMSGPLSVGQVINSTAPGSLYAASEGVKKGSLAMGVLPIVTTTWNTTTVPGTTFGTNPSGTLPLIADNALVTGYDVDPATAGYQSCVDQDTVVAGNQCALGIGSNPMATAPFPNYNANFDITSMTVTSITPAAVPVPAAVWLFGSGLLGLVGIARRKKA